MERIQERSQTPSEQQRRTWGLKDAKRRRASQDTGEKRPSSNRENFSYLHFKGLAYFFKSQMIEINYSWKIEMKQSPHHLPAPATVFDTIYCKHTKMCFRVAGSNQLEIKGRKLLQQKPLRFSFCGPCASSTSRQAEFPYPLFFLAVGNEWKLVLFLLFKES